MLSVVEYNVVFPRKGIGATVILTAITNQNTCTWFIERSRLMHKKCRIPISRSKKIKVFINMNQRGFQGWVNFDVSGSYIFLNCIMYWVPYHQIFFSKWSYCSIPLKNFIIINSGLLQQIRK